MRIEQIKFDKIKLQGTTKVNLKAVDGILESAESALEWTGD